MVLMMVLADVRVLRASLSHITSSSIYLVIIVNKYGGLLVKTKTVMLLLFVLLWQASGICMNCLFLMFLIFRLSYLQYYIVLLQHLWKSIWSTCPLLLNGTGTL